MNEKELNLSFALSVNVSTENYQKLLDNVEEYALLWSYIDHMGLREDYYKYLEKHHGK